MKHHCFIFLNVKMRNNISQSNIFRNLFLRNETKSIINSEISFFPYFLFEKTNQRLRTTLKFRISE